LCLEELAYQVSGDNYLVPCT